MITPSFGLTATERVLPKLALDFTTASLDPRVTFTRSGNIATRINSSGVVELMSANTPRFDYDPSTLVCKGLLIEESRTNAQTYAEDISNAVYTKTAVTTSTDIYTAPDGQSTGDAIVVSTATAVQGLSFTAFTADGTSSYSDSVFIKKTTGAGISVIFVFRGSISSGTQYSQLTINTSTGFISFVASGATSSAYTVTEINGWWRLTISAGGIPAGSMRCHVRLTSEPLSTTVGVWGCQHETGAFATSYIPTTASQVTRSADVATMTGTNFSDWYNATEGAFAIEGSAFAETQGGQKQGFLLVSPTVVSSSFRISIAPLGYTIVDTTTQVNQSLSSFVANTDYTVVAAYKLNDCQFASNSTLGATDTACTIPTVNFAQFGRFRSADGLLSGYIKSMRYWPQRLTGAELQAFSN